MKQYEKWAEQNMYDRTETQKAWKAALEWVSKLIGIRSPDGRLGQRCFVDELKDTVEEEIND